MQHSVFRGIVILTAIFLFAISCTDDPARYVPPDFSTVPEAFDTSGLEPVTIKDGVQAYIHEDGHGPFEVTARDFVDIFISVRTDEGDIIYSSFSSGREDPDRISMLDAGDYQNHFDSRIYRIDIVYSPGFKAGLLGMREQEQRTLVVEPGQGFRDLPGGHVSQAYRENTLYYDIRISRIEPS